MARRQPVKERLKKGGVLPLLGVLAALSAVSYFLVFAPKIREVPRLREEVEGRQTGMGGTVEGPGAFTEGAVQEKNKFAEELRLRLSFFSTYRDMAEFVDGMPRMTRLLSRRSVAVREKDGEMEKTLELSEVYRERE